MIIPSKNKRVRSLVPGVWYWMSNSRHGTLRMKVASGDETHVHGFLEHNVPVSVRISETSFFDHEPKRG